jgi:hypothetical protein
MYPEGIVADGGVRSNGSGRTWANIEKVGN